MPFGDGTGPRGLGPRTGKGAGHCSGFAVPRFMNSARGRSGCGFGYDGRAMGCYWYGGGRGWRNCYKVTGMPRGASAGYGYSSAPSHTAEEVLTFLKEEAEFLRMQLAEIQNRISTKEKSERKED